MIEAECLRSSKAERQAMEAERAMLDLRKAEFMLDHIGESHEGTIVSITQFGFYVELDKFPIEGLVRLDQLSDDYYSFVESERALVGARKHTRIRLGDRVEVECIEASTRRRTIDFRLLRFFERKNKSPEPRRTKPKPSQRPRRKKRR